VKHPAWDADMECRHGRVPFDPSPRCGCFPVEAPGFKPKVVEAPPNPRLGRTAPPGPYPEHVRRRAVQLYADGLTSTEIARRLGSSPHSVLVWVRAAGVEVRSVGARKAA
jgi:hypothetical protein